MKQQCHISMVYLSWIVYAAGLITAAWLGAWAFAAAWLIAGPVFQWLYIRNFPKFSAAMGYGRIVDEPAGAAQPVTGRVILYTALECPFCPLMEQRLEDLRARLGFSLTKVDVTLRPDLLASKGIRSVPAVEIGDRFWTGLVTSKELAEALGGRERAAGAR
jgi:glutaredoxin